MLEQRNVSGAYFRYKNPKTDKWENWCFEDLPEQAMFENLEKRTLEWVKSLIIIMLETIINIINFINEKELDITKKSISEDLELFEIWQNMNEQYSSIEFDILYKTFSNTAVFYAKKLKEICIVYGVSTKESEENDNS